MKRTFEQRRMSGRSYTASLEEIRSVLDLMPGHVYDTRHVHQKKCPTNIVSGLDCNCVVRIAVTKAKNQSMYWR